MVSLAREQVRHDGAHVLDVNVDYAGRDNARDMARSCSAWCGRWMRR
jgi:5-methyltetrahydrofolate--homocysteine methyltransferase